MLSTSYSAFAVNADIAAQYSVRLIMLPFLFRGKQSPMTSKVLDYEHYFTVMV